MSAWFFQISHARGMDRIALVRAVTPANQSARAYRNEKRPAEPEN